MAGEEMNLRAVSLLRETARFIADYTSGQLPSTSGQLLSTSSQLPSTSSQVPSTTNSGISVPRSGPTVSSRLPSSQNSSDSSVIGQALNRARSMIQSSSQRGRYNRLNQRERLRATNSSTSSEVTGSRKRQGSVKQDETKPFEFVLLSIADDENFDGQMVISDEMTALRGFIQLSTKSSEQEIRSAICTAIQTKFPLVTGNDIEFLKANRRKLIKPVNCGEYNYQQVKLLAGQGAIYVKVRDGFDFVFSNDKDEDENLADNINVDDQETQSFPQTQRELPASGLIHVPEQLLVQETNGEPTLFQKMINDIINQCKDCDNPVEILRVAQKIIVTGRILDVHDTSESLEGETNFILINRHDIMNSAKEEIESITDYRKTLEVSFYGEAARDFGGPRKEFFRLCLREIKEKYFDKGLKEHLDEEYETAGVIMALSILQNGSIPRFLSEDILKQLFEKECPHSCIAKLQSGFDKLGLIQIGLRLPLFVHLLRPSPGYAITRKKLLNILEPQFSDEGSNDRLFENAVYTVFIKYVREAGSGRRGIVTLEHILQFVTCADEEPILGFSLQPKIIFTEALNISKWAFIPTAHTCSNFLELPRGSSQITLPKEDDLLDIYDHAFCNAYFGKI